MGAGNNTLNITGGVASIYGSINGGVGGTNTMTIDPGTGNSFSYAGSISNFNTVEVRSGTVALSGASTYAGTTIVSGGTLVLDGANRLSASSTLKLNGGTLELSNASGLDAQTFAALMLSASSTLDLNGASLTFASLGALSTSATLTVLDFYAATSADYAFRLSGDYSTNADFLALISHMTIDGIAATYSVDGAYTDVRPVPIPAAWLLFASGIGLVGRFGRRKAAQIA
jgi:autotransporter-associated beta strand protein